MAPYKFSKKHCQEWMQDKKTNPKTGYSIDPKASNGVYKKLKKQCDVYEELATKTRRLSACRSRNKKLRKELISAMEKVRAVVDVPMSKKDAEQSIIATSPTLNMMQPIIEQEMVSYHPQHMKYALLVIKFMHNIIDDSFPEFTFGEIKRMGDNLIQKFEEKARQMSSPYKDQVKRVIAMLQFFMDYIEKFWNRFKQDSPSIITQDQHLIEDVSSEDEMAIVPYQPKSASVNASMGIVQYTNASRANTLRANTPRAGTPQSNASSANASRANTPRAGTPQSNASSANASRANTPQAGTPQSNASSANTPRANTPRANTPRAGTPRANASSANTPRANTPWAGTPRANTPEQKTPKRPNASMTSTPYISAASSRSVSRTPKSPPANTASALSSWMTYVPESENVQKTVRKNAQGLSNVLPVSPPVSIVDFTSTQKRAKSSVKNTVLRLDDYDMDKMLLLLDELGISKKSMKSTLAEKRSKVNALYDYIERHWDRFKQEIDEQDSNSASIPSSVRTSARVNANTAPRLSQEELQDYNRDTFMTILAFFGLSAQDLQDVDLMDVRKEYKRKANASEENDKHMEDLFAYLDRHWDQFKQDARERIVTANVNGSPVSFKDSIHSMAAAGSSSEMSSSRNIKVDNLLFNSSSASKTANRSARVTQSMNTNPLFNALSTPPQQKNSKK